jgi:uncharacterized repeat protein (TIGR02543 family)
VGNPGYYQSTNKDTTLPTPARTAYIFDGWYDNEQLTGSAVTMIPQGSRGDKTFYAKWTAASMPSDSLEELLTWLSVYAEEGGAYTITVNADEDIGPKTLSLSYNEKNVTPVPSSTVRYSAPHNIHTAPLYAP